MKAIIGASNLWPTPSLASMVLSIMLTCDDTEAFAVRLPHPDSAEASSMTEDMVLKIAQRLERKVFVYPCDRSLGSKAGWVRDNSMVDAVDEVFAFFLDASDSGGTTHIVDRALSANKRVTTYEFTPEGFVERGKNP